MMKYLAIVFWAGVFGWGANDIYRDIAVQVAKVAAEKAEKDAMAHRWATHIEAEIARIDMRGEEIGTVVSIVRRQANELEARVKQIETKTKDTLPNHIEPAQ